MSFIDQLFEWFSNNFEQPKSQPSKTNQEKTFGLSFLYNQPTNIPFELLIDLIKEKRLSYIKDLTYVNERRVNFLFGEDRRNYVRDNIDELEFHNEIFNNSIKIISYYHRYLGNWNKKIFDIDWFKHSHPRKDSIYKGDDIYESLRLYHLGFPSNNDGAHLNRINFIMMRSVLEFLDAFSYFIKTHINSKNIDSMTNQYFPNTLKNVPAIGFKSNSSITKSMACDFFLTCVGEGKVSLYFRKALKLLIAWNVPQNKSLASFPNGELVHFPIQSNRQFARMSSYLLNRLCGVPSTVKRYSPPYVYLDETGNSPQDYPLEKTRLPELEVFDNPLFFDTSIFKNLIPQK